MIARLGQLLLMLTLDRGRAPRRRRRIRVGCMHADREDGRILGQALGPGELDAVLMNHHGPILPVCSRLVGEVHRDSEQRAGQPLA